MSDTQIKDKLIEEILKELGTLLRMRIDAYLIEHYNGNKYKFINQFIIIPMADISKHDGRLCYDLISHSIDKAKHLISGLSTPFDLTVTAIYLSDQGSFTYDFHCCDYELGEEDNVDINFEFTLIEDKIEMPEVYRNEIASLGKQTLESILGKIKLDFYR